MSIQDIRQLVAEQETAMRARDAEALVGLYTPDAVTFTLAPPLKQGAPDVAGLQSWFATFDGPIEYETRDLDVTEEGDIAFCHSLNRLSATPQGSSEPFNLWYRATLCLRRVDGAWRIAHEHNSTPFYMDGTFAAALDLEP